MEKSRIKLAALVALLLLVSAAGAFAQDDDFEENLLTNGTADDGLDGWTDYDGIWATDRKVVSPHDGAFFWPKKFSRKKAGGDSTALMQALPAGPYIDKTLTLSAVARSKSGQKDTASLVLAATDENGNVFKHEVPSFATGGDWQEISVSMVVPPGSAKIVASIVGKIGANDNGNLDAYFDDVTLVVSGSDGMADGSGDYGNIITNGTGDNGLSGWFDVFNEWAADKKAVKPSDGPCFWAKNFNGEDTDRDSSFLVWKFPADGYRGRTLQLSADLRVKSRKNDKAALLLMVNDEHGKEIANEMLGATTEGEWENVSVSLTIPDDAKEIWACLCAGLQEGARGRPAAYFDNVSLTVEGGGSSYSGWSDYDDDGYDDYGADDYDVILEEGDSYRLPSGDWQSSDSSVVKVSKNGKAVAKGEGTAVLTSSSGKKFVIKVEE